MKNNTNKKIMKSNFELLNDPNLNKGTSFTLEERKNKNEVKK